MAKKAATVVPTKTKEKTPAPAKVSRKSVKKDSAKLKPKQKTPRKPHQTRPTRQEEAEIIERRYLVWDLFRAGASYRQISTHLIDKGIKTASVGTVFSDVQWCLDLQHEGVGLSVVQHIENEVAIVNDVQFNFYPIMQNKKNSFKMRKESSEVVMGCVEKRAKLRNLYKAKQIKLSVDDELAKLLNIAAEELPDVS